MVLYQYFSRHIDIIPFYVFLQLSDFLNNLDSNYLLVSRFFIKIIILLLKLKPTNHKFRI